MQPAQEDNKGQIPGAPSHHRVNAESDYNTLIGGESISLFAPAQHACARFFRNPRFFHAARIRIYWPLDEKWYSGTVTSFDCLRNRHQVLYDDEDSRWYDLSTRRWNVLHWFDE